MHKLIFFLALIMNLHCVGQEFMVHEFINNDSLPKLDRKQFTIYKDNIFEDSFFIVSKTCSGEWGGTVIFKEKRTGIEYLARATCPVIVNKLNGKYYVTNTLAHLRGSSEILEINDPRAMSIVQMPRQPAIIRQKRERFAGDEESKSSKGTKQVLHLSGELIMASFIYEDKLFHVVTDYEKTYLAKIEDGKLITVSVISNQRLWTYSAEVFVTPDSHYLMFFFNAKTNGYFDIYKNTITIVRQE